MKLELSLEEDIEEQQPEERGYSKRRVQQEPRHGGRKNTQSRELSVV